MTHEEEMLVVINMAKNYITNPMRKRFDPAAERALRVAWNNTAAAYKEAISER